MEDDWHTCLLDQAIAFPCCRAEAVRRVTARRSRKLDGSVSPVIRLVERANQPCTALQFLDNGSAWCWPKTIDIGFAQLKTFFSASSFFWYNSSSFTIWFGRSFFLATGQHAAGVGHEPRRATVSCSPLRAPLVPEAIPSPRYHEFLSLGPQS
jgi:hypothetical protein